MTIAARIVLDDCREELKEIAGQLPASVWRRHWIALLVLLRAVGHVLHKVDGARSAVLRREVNAWWKEINQSKTSYPLFWEFIELERNSFIKKYETAARQVVAIRVGAVNYDAKSNSQWSDPPQPAHYFRHMVSGQFAGRDPREVAHAAVGWWEQQLAAIDCRVQSASQPGNM